VTDTSDVLFSKASSYTSVLGINIKDLEAAFRLILVSEPTNNMLIIKIWRRKERPPTSNRINLTVILCHANGFNRGGPGSDEVEK
jgi:hypothetical protein